MEPIPYAHLQLTYRLLSEQHIGIGGNRPCSSHEKSECERREEGRDDETHSPDVNLSKGYEVIFERMKFCLPSLPGDGRDTCP